MSAEDLRRVAERVTSSYLQMERRQRALYARSRTRASRRMGPGARGVHFFGGTAMRRRVRHFSSGEGGAYVAPPSLRRSAGRFIGANIQRYLGSIRRSRVAAGLARIRTTRQRRQRRVTIMRTARSGVRNLSRASRVPWGHVQSYF